MDEREHAAVRGQRGTGLRGGPVQAEHLAGQVVGADGEEVDRRGEVRRRGGGGGDLDHDAEFGRVGTGLGGGLGERGADLGHLVQVLDHRDQDGELSIGACEQDRPELVPECFRRAEQSGQARFFVSQEGRDLVAGEVEQPDDRRPAREQAEGRRQAGQVIGLRRPARGAGERDLGAQQAYAGRAAGQAKPGFCGRGDVAEQRDRLAVGRGDSLRGTVHEVPRYAGRRGEVELGLRVRVDDQLPSAGVQDRRVPCRRGQHPRVGARQHGQPEAARDDRGVGAGPACD